MNNLKRKENYNKYLQSDAWKEKRKLVIKRAQGMCEKCKIKEIKEVHHISYINFGNEELYELLGVCEACHNKIHANKKNEPEIVKPLSTLLIWRNAVIIAIRDKRLIDQIIDPIETDLCIYSNAIRRIKEIQRESGSHFSFSLGVFDNDLLIKDIKEYIFYIRKNQKEYFSDAKEELEYFNKKIIKSRELKERKITKKLSDMTELEKEELRLRISGKSTKPVEEDVFKKIEKIIENLRIRND